jgi:hypothetical protein
MTAAAAKLGLRLRTASIMTAFLTAVIATATGGGSAGAAELISPQGLRWGASPQEVNYQLVKAFKFIGPTDAPNPDRFLHEQRYEGDVLGLHSDHIGPLFYAGRFFCLAVSFSPTPTSPASRIWDTLVAKLTALYGKPASKTKPLVLLSWNAMLRLLPAEANKGKLMELYNAADKDRVLGNYMLLDLQIAAGGWVPEAVWTFTNGATVKAVMRAGAIGEYGLSNLKPAVLYTRYEELK